MSTSSDPIDTLTRCLQDLPDDSFLLVVTGAGVSLASGIPTFRGSDPDAVWATDVLELATLGFFRRDPVTSWRWYRRRFDLALAAQPNPAHRALASLERWQEARGSRFLLVTQNIDTLHEQAGSRRLVKVHGSLDRLRCSRDGCEHGAPRGSLARDTVDLTGIRDEATMADLPHCPLCGELLRPHVLWFDEYYQGHEDYRFDEVLAAAQAADLVLFVGTSFSVGVTDLVHRITLSRQVPILSVDPAAPTDRPLMGIRILAMSAETLLPALCRRLGALQPPT